MTKRLYFTDPIKAAWMSRNFGVKLFLEAKNCYSIEYGIEIFNKGVCEMEEVLKTDGSWDKYLQSTGEQRYIKQPTGWEERIYVAKESESIFDIKEGDFVTNSLLEGRSRHCHGFAFKANVLNKESVTIETPERHNGKTYFVEDRSQVTIIMRDNKQFFNPEIESND